MDNPKRVTSLSLSLSVTHTHTHTHTHTSRLLNFYCTRVCSNRTRETVIAQGSLCVQFKYTSTYEDRSADGQSAGAARTLLDRDRWM